MKKEIIIQKLNKAFKNGDFELLETNNVNELSHLLNCLESMKFKNVEKASKVLNAINCID